VSTPAADPGSPEAAEQSHSTKALVRLTMACNERCPFCNVPAEDYSPRPTPEGELRRTLDRVVAAGEQTLTISGGEPTLLRRRLLAFAREARGRGVRFIELQTNAVLIDPGYAGELAEAGVTSAFVSLLSHVPEHHDALAGLKGAFPRCLAGIDALLDAGVRVALNPVTSLATQGLVADYVDFVAERLPRVSSISLSAVQPHGRGAANAAALLPDYAALAPAIREARARAARRGITLLNPYCGLPLCVGWHDDTEHSVEAVEALAAARDPAGLDNRGNKSHGRPCGDCALRTRCGGAWHAYWTLRGGAGIAAPAILGDPWAGPGPLEAVVQAPGGPSDTTWAALAQAPDRPNLWLRTDRLRRADAGRLLASRCTDLALDWGRPDRETLVALRGLLRLQGGRDPQRLLRVTAGVSAAEPAAALEAVKLAAALGVRRVRLLGGPPALAGRLGRALSGVDVRAISPARPHRAESRIEGDP
jgi:MoaA/NifB/PqqE/SkfB family radical SAM enzyme